jgi:alpha-tubulin suppressor-like RCC1 family protein
VWAWGWNVFGQIGDGTTTDRHLPVQVGGAALVRQVAAGAFHSMALNASGLQTWGYNAYGQLGDGTNVDRHAPVDLVSHNSDGSFRYRWTAMTIAAGAYHSLATESDGRVLTWGWNGFGQLGDGTTMTRFEPALIQLGTGPGTFALSASAGLAHSAALRADGTVMTWGWNGAGQLGDGTTIDRHSPVAIGGAGESLQLSAGWVHTVSVRVDGSVQSWGWNAYGQLGTGSTVDRHVPGPVFGLSGADIVAAGPYQTLAL